MAISGHVCKSRGTRFMDAKHCQHSLGNVGLVRSGYRLEAVQQENGMDFYSKDALPVLGLLLAIMLMGFGFWSVFLK